MLVKKGSKEINWLSSWWLDAAYLTYRLPVVVHSSPGLVFPKQRFDAFDDQLTYAAKLIVGALHYKAIVDGAKLKQDYLGKNPLCMAQYTKVFSGCRIPGLPKDSIRQCHDAQHIVVAFNNHFFKVVVTDELGRIPSTAAILQALRHLVRHVPQPSHPVGVLTTESRDTWAAVYPKLLKDEGNAASLKAIEDSMFVMCLDKANDSLPTEMTLRSRMASQLLHGLGSHNNSGNRWFDKTLQLIVGADGTNGLCYEHSPAEGPPMANLADFIVDFAAKESVPSQLGVDISSVEHLGFQLTPDLVEDVAKASHNIDALAADVDMNSFTFDAYGKEEIKGLKFSPDSFIQVALQTAFIRVHGHPTAHYESASTRKFAEGRTDTIRSCLPEIANFASCLLGKTNASEREKYAALQAAVQSHKDYVQAAIDGQGIDRHLLGMKLLAMENGMALPSLYTDSSYSKSTNFRVSTSQVAARHDMVMCFGPVVTDGYGCCYNPRRDEINFAVSTLGAGRGATSAAAFGSALTATLVEMRSLALRNLPSSL